MTIVVNPTSPASARDYNWLVAALGKWSGNRTDLGPMIPDFVMLAEKRLSADLESRMQETVAPVNAVATVQTIDLPADLAEIRSLTLPGTGPLGYLPPDQFNAKYPATSSGPPKQFTVVGQQIYLGPIPDSTYSLNMAYRAFLPALADTAGTNWLITSHANCYLAACMCELLGYTKNLAELQMWETKYTEAIASVNKPDWYTGSSMTVRSDARTF